MCPPLRVRFAIACCLYALTLQAFDLVAADYLTQVKPLLRDHCQRCHGPSQQKGELRTDTAAFLQRGGENGPAISPGNPDRSLLLQVLRGDHAEISRMPYKKPPLPDDAIALVREWIAAGSPAPKDEEPAKDIHWAFLPPARPIPPTPSSSGRSWVQNPIDAFILERLEREKIAPAAEADRSTLLRRAALDITGLPPRPADVLAFEQTTGSDAYERLVDQLLASPAFGERWGRHWLDVARYADSNGYSIDAPRSIWKYRDWVIDAFNRDLPFDEFVRWQMAGDLLPNATLEQRIATGFHRNTQINQEGGIDPEQFRIDSVIDRVNTTATAFLGLTLSCTQCHDHKFDPFRQKEYFQLFAFLNDCEEPEIEVPGEFTASNVTADDIRQAEVALDNHLGPRTAETRQRELALSDSERAKLGADVRKALEVAPDTRSGEQRRLIHAALAPEDAEFRKLRKRLDDLRRRGSRPVTTLVLEARREPRRSYLFIKGDFTRDGGTVEPATPAVLHPLQTPPQTRSPVSDATAPRPTRLDLANWLVDTNNPLIARVTVNRIWQHYFGRGLVETENDFGTQGTPPSHPELLDWLATEFMAPANGGTPWSQKYIHRLILTSATYRQSSRARPDLEVKDPLNRLLARQSRLRLDAEVIRDSSLAAAGLLSRRIGGPSVFPPQPDGVLKLGQVAREWHVSPGADRYRRGLYTFLFRATPHPALAVFDAPDAFSACTRRIRSNTPLQALTLLNDQAFFEMAQALARDLTRHGPASEAARVEQAFQRCLARTPSPTERDKLLALHRRALEAAQGDSLRAWTTVCRTLLNLDEAVTRE